MCTHIDLYFVCYDHGYGECGVHEAHMLTDEVIDWLTNRYSSEMATAWVNASDHDWFEASPDITILHTRNFDEERWSSKL